MKKLISIVLIGGINFAYAQLTNAILAIQDGDVKVAKESIDKYMAKPKSDQDPKGWYYKGNIYESIAFTKDSLVVGKLETKQNAIKTTAEAYQKAISLDKPNGEWAKQAKDRVEGVWANSLNEGINKYNVKDYKTAIEFLKLASDVKPSDTLSVVNTGLIAIEARDFVSAKGAFLKLISMGYKTKRNYSQAYFISKDELKDDAETARILAEARTTFPTDAYFMTEEINALIKADKKEEAISKLNGALSTDPANAAMYQYNLGLLYNQTGDKLKAKESFNQSLAKDSLYADSNYMMGFMLLEEGDVINKKINQMKMPEYQAKGKSEEAKRDNVYKSAIPYLEKSYSVSKEPALKSQLNNLYAKHKINKKIQ